MAVFRHVVDLTWGGPGSPGANIWHSRFDPATATTPQAAIDTIKDFYTALAGVFAPGLKASHTGEVVDVDTDESETYTGFTVTSTTSGSPAPQALQLVCSWRTSLKARRGMGRTFVGPLAFSWLSTDGSPTDSLLTTVRSAASALVTASESHVGQALGVYGLQDEWESWPAPPPASEPRVLRDITGSKVNDKFAVLRSRRD